MDESSIMSRDPELEASFSFSSYDFTNSADNEDDDDDEYIEIALQQPTTHADDDASLETLRISFSSSAPFLELSCNNNNNNNNTVESLGIESVNTPSSSTSTSTLSSSSSATHQPSSSNIKRKVQFRAVNRPLGSLMFIPRTPSEIVDNNNQEHESSRQVAIHARKSAKMKKTRSGGIMVKLLINIRTVLASLMKPYQIIINAPLQGGGENKKKWLVQRDKRNDNNGEIGMRSRVFDINMDAIRGVWDKNIKKRSSPPAPMSSSNSTTTTDNSSIHAAIIHCKTSFGQTSDFCFV